MNLSSESSTLCPVHFLQDRREIGGQAIQLFATFVELSVFKEWTSQGVGRVPDVGTVGKYGLHLLAHITVDLDSLSSLMVEPVDNDVRMVVLLRLSV